MLVLLLLVLLLLLLVLLLVLLLLVVIVLVFLELLLDLLEWEVVPIWHVNQTTNQLVRLFRICFQTMKMSL